MPEHFNKLDGSDNSHTVATITYRLGSVEHTVQLTRGEITIAFNAVCNQSNWKLPIDMRIDLDAYGMAAVKEAVIFFTGSVPTFTPISGSTISGWTKYRVTAPGYYAAVGA